MKMDRYLACTTILIRQCQVVQSNSTVRPSVPRIVHPVPIDSIITGTEGEVLTLACISEGGFPEWTVDWYKTRVEQSSLKLLTCTTHAVISQLLYNVTTTCTMIPTREDDGAILLCQSSHPGTPAMIEKSGNATLRLLCKLPTVNCKR